jgi:hypothetical protein
LLAAEVDVAEYVGGADVHVGDLDLYEDSLVFGPVDDEAEGHLLVLLVQGLGD